MRTFRRPGPWVFVILLASYAYFWQARDWNIASRLMLTYAMVDGGTLTIDGFDDQTRDIARYRGHYYSDKTPGLAILAVVPYLASKTALGLPDHPKNRPGFAYWPADYWATLGTSGLLTAITGVILVGLARDLGCGPRRSALVGLSYGLATPAFAYATMAYGHQASAFALLASFALIRNPWSRPNLGSAIAGFLAAFASVVEIQVGPVSALLGIFLVAMVVGKRAPVSTILAFGLGATVPTVLLLSYNMLAFGSPWRMGYFYEVLDRFKDVHNSSNPLGMGRPDWSRIGDLIWGERRGLLRFAPILVLTIPGLFVLAARKAWGTAIVSALTIASVLLVNLSYPEWTGGWSTGPRLLLPMVPFAMLPVAALLATNQKAVTLGVFMLTTIGAAVILGFVTIGARVPDFVDRPLIEGVWPLLRGEKPLPGWVFGNRFARNLASLAGPRVLKDLPDWAGSVSVLPLVAFQVGMIALMSRFVRASEVLEGAEPASR